MLTPGVLLLIATALLVGALVIGLAIIIVQLVRISSALAEASEHIGLVPEQLAPLDPAVSKYIMSVRELRGAFEQSRTVNDG